MPRSFDELLSYSWDLLSKFEKKSFDDLTNLLYTLDVSTVIDAISIKEIAEHTSRRPNS